MNQPNVCCGVAGVRQQARQGFCTASCEKTTMRMGAGFAAAAVESGLCHQSYIHLALGCRGMTFYGRREAVSFALP